MNHTDIHKVKEIAKDFLYIEISTTDYSPIVVMHPFFESGIIPYKIDDEFKVLNIAENKKDLQFILLQMEKKIDQLGQVHQIFQLIRKSYRLTFYRNIKQKTPTSTGGRWMLLLKTLYFGKIYSIIHT